TWQVYGTRPSMKGLIALLAIGLRVLSAAWPDAPPDKQWYKPTSNYTTAAFDRDRDACTDKKTKVLDEGCMKDRGWVALGGDIGPAVKAPDPSTAGRGKGKD